MCLGANQCFFASLIELCSEVFTFALRMPMIVSMLLHSLQVYFALKRQSVVVNVRVQQNMNYWKFEPEREKEL